jgi:hypothetical protein
LLVQHPFFGHPQASVQVSFTASQQDLSALQHPDMKQQLPFAQQFPAAQQERTVARTAAFGAVQNVAFPRVTNCPRLAEEADVGFITQQAGFGCSVGELLRATERDEVISEAAAAAKAVITVRIAVRDFIVFS